jgi:DNA-binding MarR family transcriptional regulator
LKTASRFAKGDFEALSEFRYQLRRFLRFSEDAAEEEWLTSMQYLLQLHIKGIPDRESATVVELAERLQSQHHDVVALISRSEAVGLVAAPQALRDRRQIIVILTQLGEQRRHHLAKLHRVELQILANVFKLANISAFNYHD